MRMEFDIVVVGSGFAGSLMATIAATLGLRVALLERGRHPRFAMGESSTPLANLLLEELSRRYGLNGLLPLAKWGSWQEKLPHIPCGLKRGFSFVHHRRGESSKVGETWQRQLMVAASPRESIADTHWFREDFDQYFLSEAQRNGVSYFDEWETSGLEPGLFDRQGEIRGTIHGTSLNLRFQCLIDASGGGGGVVGKFLGFKRELPFGFPETRTLYSHFADVPLWGDLHPQDEMVPYPIDDSALHHVFEDGWAWVLRFNNGVTSAGVIAREGGETARELEPTSAGWSRFLNRFPSIGEQLQRARPLRPFMGCSPVAFVVDRVVSGRCLLLPSAAGFLDPMFSTGFPLTLLGIERLATWMELNSQGLKRGGSVAWNDLDGYEKETRADLEVTARFMSAIYRVMDDFPSFHQLSLLYFAAAIYSETLRRLGKDGGSMGFLLRNHGGYSRALEHCCLGAGILPVTELQKLVEAAIRPIDLGGLLEPRFPLRYWAELEPMLRGAGLVGASRHEMAATLEKVEFWK